MSRHGYSTAWIWRKNRFYSKSEVLYMIRLDTLPILKSLCIIDDVISLQNLDYFGIHELEWSLHLLI